MKYLERFFEPDGWHSGTFTNKEGKQIRYGRLEPKGEKKGTVIITTGYADFIESHYETIHDYVDRGYAVWIMDWVGQGGSDKKMSWQGKPQTIDDHVEDLHQFRRDVVQFDETKPLFLSTHSMGGQIGLHYLHRYPEDFDFAVLAAPFINFNYTAEVCSLLRAGFKKAVELGMAAKPLRDWRRIAARRRINSHRKEIREQDLLHMDIHRTFMLLDETLRAENPTYGMIDSMFQAAFRLHDPSFLNSITTPILIGIGEKDDIVNNEAIERAAALLPESTSVRVKEGLHGLWTERSPVRAEWWGYVDGFLNDRHLKLGAVLSPARFGSVNDNISSLIPKGPHAA